MGTFWESVFVILIVITYIKEVGRAHRTSYLRFEAAFRNLKLKC